MHILSVMTFLCVAGRRHQVTEGHSQHAAAEHCLLWNFVTNWCL